MTGQKIIDGGLLFEKNSKKAQKITPCAIL